MSLLTGKETMESTAWEEYEGEVLDVAHIGWSHPRFDTIKRLIEEEVVFLKQSIQVESGIECARCKSTRTYSYQKQVRKADEGFTTFTFCFDCKKQTVE